jgi:hypothetical protein
MNDAWRIRSSTEDPSNDKLARLGNVVRGGEGEPGADESSEEGDEGGDLVVSREAFLRGGSWYVGSPKVSKGYRRLLDATVGVGSSDDPRESRCPSSFTDDSSESLMSMSEGGDI